MGESSKKPRTVRGFVQLKTDPRIPAIDFIELKNKVVLLPLTSKAPLNGMY